MTDISRGNRRIFLGRLGAGLAATGGSFDALAAGDWPGNPVKILLGMVAGGPPDANLRAISEVLSQKLKRPFVVENKVGATGILALQALQAAAPDGRTIGYLSQTALWALPLMRRQSILNNLDCVTRLYDTPSIAMVAIDSPYKTMADFIDGVRRAPGKLTHGSGGTGSPGQMAMQMVRLATRTDILDVPYRGGPELVNALVGKQIDIGMVMLGPAHGLIETRRLRPLAVTSSSRMTALPDVPTMNEALGVTDFELSAWGGIAVPKGVPKPIIHEMFEELAAATKTRLVRDTADKVGAVIALSKSPEEFAEFLARERARAVTMLKDIGLFK